MDEFVNEAGPYVKQVHVWNTRSLVEYKETHTHHLPSPEQDPSEGWMDIPYLAEVLDLSLIDQVIIEGTFTASNEEFGRSRKYLETLFPDP